MINRLAIALALVLYCTAGWAQTLVIKNADLVIGDGTRKKGDLLIRDGKIAQVGKVTAPKAAEVIDAKGQPVTPGFVDAYNVLGLVEVGLESSTREGQFAGGDDVVHAAYRVVDGYNPWSVAIPVARTGGVTSVVSVPRGGLVSGQAAWLGLASGKMTEDLNINSSVAMHVTLGQRAQGVAHGSRGMALEMLRELLDDAKELKKRRSQFERNQTRGFAASRLDLLALTQVVDRKMPLLIWAHRASDISAAIRLKGELGINVIVVGGSEAWMVAPALAAAKVPVVLDPTGNLPASFDQIRVRNDNVVLLQKAGVDVVISVLGDAAGSRNLRQLAGVAVSYGLGWDDALAALTSTPARIYGESGRGLLKKGSAADVVVWTGDPLELWTRPTHVIVAGEIQSLDTHQTRLRDRYMGR